MYVGLACGATAVLVPEEPIDFEKDVIEKIRQARFNGFTHYMIVVAEGAGKATDIAKQIKGAIDLGPRVTVLVPPPAETESTPPRWGIWL